MSEDTLRELISENLSSRSIAERLECSQSTINYWLKKFNLKTMPKIKALVKVDDYICTSCNTQLTKDDFYMKESLRHTYCKNCFNKQVIERQRKIKQDAVDYKGGKCSNCGYNKYLGALQFHHLDPSVKDPQWNNFKCRKFDDAFKLELDKCALLCANCHSEQHATN